MVVLMERGWLTDTLAIFNILSLILASASKGLADCRADS